MALRNHRQSIGEDDWRWLWRRHCRGRLRNHLRTHKECSGWRWRLWVNPVAHRTVSPIWCCRLQDRWRRCCQIRSNGARLGTKPPAESNSRREKSPRGWRAKLDVPEVKPNLTSFYICSNLLSTVQIKGRFFNQLRLIAYGRPKPVRCTRRAGDPYTGGLINAAEDSRRRRA